jgi:hypothetical protein
VLSGLLSVQGGRQRVDVAAGSFALIPRGLVHSIADPALDPVPTLISRAQSEWIEAEHELCARAEGTRPPARRVRAGPAQPAPVSMAWPHRATRCDPGRTDAALRRGTGQHQGSASLPSLLRRSPFSVSALELRRRSGLDPEA